LVQILGGEADQLHRLIVSAMGYGCGRPA
jgi:hypothetical protein